jgi:hypothetical protein
MRRDRKGNRRRLVIETMSWQRCYNLLIACEGRTESIDGAEIAEATATGPGDAATQMRIAEIEYQRMFRKAIDDEQKRWEF